MSEIKKVLRCYKCGVILQDEDVKEAGYIVPEVLSNHKSEILMCNECFNKLIYKPTPTIMDFEEDFYSILEDAKATDALVLLVIDLFSFEGAVPQRFVKLMENVNVIVVGNKRDLFPKNIDDSELKTYVEHRLRVAKLNVLDVILTSSLQNYNIDVLLSKIDELRARRDVYLIGYPYSGKTSLANYLLKHYKNKTNRVISTIDYHGTEIKVVEIPLDRTSSLYDVPSLQSYNTIFDVVEPTLINDILIKKQINAKKDTMYVGYGLALGGLARVDLIKGNKTEVKVFMSDKIELRMLKAKNIDDLYYSLIKKKSLEPVSKKLQDYDNFDMYDITVTEEGERDIGILGLGWISFTGKGQTFRIVVPKGVYVYTSRAKVKLNAKKQTKK